MNLNATLFVQIVVFLIFAVFTAKVVWPPLVKVLDERSQRIADSLAAAEKSKQEVANVEAQVQAEIKKAREEGAKRILEAEQRANVVAADIKAKAEADAAKIIEQAKAEAKQEIFRAKEELRGQVAALAMKGAEQILKREISSANHADLLKQISNEL
ncbi:MAG: F0F1 ATP synthase subunit B [Oxalobacter sp.]